MADVVSEFIVSLDNCGRGTQSLPYYGYSGEEFAAWLKAKNAQPHRNLVGRKTYEMLNSIPAQDWDKSWQTFRQQAGFLFSRVLKRCEWAGLQIIREDMLEYVRALKQEQGSELRLLGSISIMRQLVEAELLDVLRLIVCPLILPETGIERIFDGMRDRAFRLVDHRILDQRVLVLDYRPDGPPRKRGHLSP